MHRREQRSPPAIISKGRDRKIVVLRDQGASLHLSAPYDTKTVKAAIRSPPKILTKGTVHGKISMFSNGQLSHKIKSKGRGIKTVWVCNQLLTLNILMTGEQA